MSEQRVVVVHQAGSATEAVVVRGLLESAGIASPGPTSTDPLPMRQPPEGFRDTDIVVLESQADEARRVIADYVASGESIEIEENESSEPEDTSKG